MRHLRRSLVAHCGPCSFAWAGAVWPVTSKRCAGGRRYATIRHVSRAEVREKASHHASGPTADTRKRISFLHPFAFSVRWRLAFSGGLTRKAGCCEIATGGRIKTEALWQCGVPVFFVIITCDLAGFFFFCWRAGCFHRPCVVRALRPSAQGCSVALWSRW